MKKSLFILLFTSVYTGTFAQSFDLEGHRGARGLMPENSIPAFKKALDLGVTTLEMDVCISKDKKVVVSHEPYMNALYSTKPNGEEVTKAEEASLNLYQMPYKEIKQFDTGKRGNALFPEQEKVATYKPLLSEVIKVCEAYIKEKGLNAVQYNIEIKSEVKEYGISQPVTVEEFSDLVYREIIKYLPANRVILQSFDFNILKFWHKQIETQKYKRIALSALDENTNPEKAFEELGFLPNYFSPNYKSLTKEHVQYCHDKNVKVVPWTVNTLEDIKKIKAMGVDGLITDYPNRAKDK